MCCFCWQALARHKSEMDGKRDDFRRGLCYVRILQVSRSSNSIAIENKIENMAEHAEGVQGGGDGDFRRGRGGCGRDRRSSSLVSRLFIRKWLLIMFWRKVVPQFSSCKNKCRVNKYGGEWKMGDVTEFFKQEVQNHAWFCLGEAVIYLGHVEELPDFH